MDVFLQELHNEVVTAWHVQSWMQIWLETIHLHTFTVLHMHIISIHVVKNCCAHNTTQYLKGVQEVL